MVLTEISKHFKNMEYLPVLIFDTAGQPHPQLHDNSPETFIILICAKQTVNIQLFCKILKLNIKQRRCPFFEEAFPYHRIAAHSSDIHTIIFRLMRAVFFFTEVDHLIRFSGFLRCQIGLFF